MLFLRRKPLKGKESGVCRGGCQGRKGYAREDLRVKTRDILLDFMISWNDFICFGAMLGRRAGESFGDKIMEFYRPSAKNTAALGRLFGGMDGG